MGAPGVWRTTNTVSTRVTSLTLDSVSQLPWHARRCVFWEIDPVAVNGSRTLCDTEFEKEAWLSSVMLEWGSCGQVLTLGGSVRAARMGSTVSGYAFYAPPNVVPRSTMFPTSPVSPDAILMTTLYVNELAAAEGFEEVLIQAVIDDLVRRGVRAIEAFGYVPAEGEDPPPSLHDVHVTPGDCRPETCMIRASRLLGSGFSIVSHHHRFPRLRLELDRDHGWKADVEAALSRLLEVASINLSQTASPSAVGV